MSVTRMLWLEAFTTGVFSSETTGDWDAVSHAAAATKDKVKRGAIRMGRHDELWLAWNSYHGERVTKQS